MGSDLLGEQLVDGDIAVGPVASFGVEDSGKEGMDREVTAAQAVVEAAVNRHVFPHRLKRLEQGGGLPAGAGGLREEALLLEAEEISDRHEAPCSDAGSGSGLQGANRFRGLGQEGGESRQGQGGSGGLEEEAAAGENGFHGAERGAQMPETTNTVGKSADFRPVGLG